MQTHKEKFCTDMDIRYSVDTVVVGGGTAGCFAAISAARSGAGTLLIEKNGILGGTMTVGGVLFPGLFYAWGKQIIAGPCWESILRTVALGGAELPEITETDFLLCHSVMLLYLVAYIRLNFRSLLPFPQL